MLPNHTSSVCSVCSVVIMTSFTIRWQRTRLVWEMDVWYGFRFSKTVKTTEHTEHTEYGMHRFQDIYHEPRPKG